MNLSKFFLALSLFLCLSVVLIIAEPATFPMTVIDDLGTEITISAKPQRIVSLTVFSDDVLIEVVDKKRLVAVTTFAEDKDISNIADRVADMPNKIALNVEIVLSLKPDLVLVANWSDADNVKQLRNLGVAVYLMESALTVDTIAEKIRTLSKIVGETEKGEAVIADMNGRLKKVTDKVNAISDVRRLSVLDYAVWGTAQGEGTSWAEVVAKAGLINSVGDLPVNDWGQVPLSKEKLIELDPDIIILPGWVYGDPDGANNFYIQTMDDPALKGMSAIKNEQAFKMPENLKTTTSQYIVDAIEFLAALAYPDLF